MVALVDNGQWTRLRAAAKDGPASTRLPKTWPVKLAHCTDFSAGPPAVSIACHATEAVTLEEEDDGIPPGTGYT